MLFPHSTIIQASGCSKLLSWDSISRSVRLEEFVGYTELVVLVVLVVVVFHVLETKTMLIK